MKNDKKYLDPAGVVVSWVFALYLLFCAGYLLYGLHKENAPSVAWRMLGGG